MLDSAAAGWLQRSFAGELIGRDHPMFAGHRRTWNGSIDRRPALIARCIGVGDVVSSLAFARRTGVPLAVRSGGHSFAGHSVCDDGLVIDLGAMKQIRVDPEAGTVGAEAGVVLGELDAATQPFGLAVPTGSVTHTGLAGLTLGGGIGWLMRKHGLTIDHLLSAEVVTADGEILTASDVQNTDLFWGLRGGGGNFGIVTRFEFALSAVGPSVLSGLLLWTLDDAPDVLRSYRAWAEDAPDELTTLIVIRRAPAIEVIPEHLHGRLVLGLACCWSGPIERGEPVLEPMRRLGRSVVDLIAPRPFVELQAMFDRGFPPGIWAYSKAADVASLNDDVVDTLNDHGSRIASERSAITAWQLGGAVARVDASETAFGSRASGYLIDVLGATDGPDGFVEEREWARDCWADLAAHRAGAYINWLMDEGAEHVIESYGREHYARLKALKRQYDPDNVFRLNQNVAPN